MPALPVVSSSVQPKTPIDGTAREELGVEEAMDAESPTKEVANEAHINGVVAGMADLELAIPEDIATQKKVGTASRQCFRRKRFVACGLCSLLFTIALAVCLPLFWPRDPSWELTNMTVNSTVLGEFVGVFGIYWALPKNATVFPELPELTMAAEVDLHNPNYLGGQMLGPGDFTVSFHAQALGSGQCSPALIEGKSMTPLTCIINVKMQPQTFRELIAEVLADLKRPLTVQVSGGTKVRGLLGIELDAGTTCDVQADVMAFMDPAKRNKVVVSSECRYHYF